VRRTSKEKERPCVEARASTSTYEACVGYGRRRVHVARTRRWKGNSARACRRGSTFLSTFVSFLSHSSVDGHVFAIAVVCDVGLERSSQADILSTERIAGA